MNNPSLFDRAVGFTLREEGGLSNDPNDPGGATNFGISFRFAGSIGLDIDDDGKTTNADIVALTRYDAIRIYRKHFWLPLNCDAFPFAIALCLFDGGVNQGRQTVAKRLQRAADTPADGIIGPNTVRAVNFAYSTRRRDLLDDFVARRLKRYSETANVDRYGRGWFRRLLKVYAIGLSEFPDS